MQMSVPLKSFHPRTTSNAHCRKTPRAELSLGERDTIIQIAPTHTKWRAIAGSDALKHSTMILSYDKGLPAYTN